MALVSQKAMQVKIKTTRQGVGFSAMLTTFKPLWTTNIASFVLWKNISYLYIYCNNENLIWNTCNYCRIPSKMRHSFSLISFSHKYLTQICTWHGNFLDVFSFSAVWSILCMFRRNRARWSFKVVSHSINDSDIHRAAQMSSVRHTV